MVTYQSWDKSLRIQIAKVVLRKKIQWPWAINEQWMWAMNVSNEWAMNVSNEWPMNVSNVCEQWAMNVVPKGTSAMNNIKINIKNKEWCLYVTQGTLYTS